MIIQSIGQNYLSETVITTYIFEKIIKPYQVFTKTVSCTTQAASARLGAEVDSVSSSGTC